MDSQAQAGQMTLPIRTVADEAAQKIKTWATSTDRFAYGHLRTAQGFGSAWRLHINIAEYISQVDINTLVIFIGSDRERTVHLHQGRPQWEYDPVDAYEPYFMAYNEVPGLLSENRADIEPSSWLEGGNLREWERQRRLPNRVFIVLAIEPQMSVDCALSMALVARWAIDVGDRPEARVRILTMSDETHSEVMDDIVRACSPSPWGTGTQLFSATNNETSRLGECHCWAILDGDDPYRLIGAMVEHHLSEDPAETHALIWYGGSPMLDSPYREWEEFDSLAGFSPGRLDNPSPGKVVVLLVEDGTLPYMRLAGFDHVHILTTSVKPRHALKEVSDATFQWREELEAEVSQPERRDQLAWVEWVSCRPENIHVYADGGIDAFVNGGPLQRQTRVQTSEASNLAVMLAQYSEWGNMPSDGILRAFLRYAPLYRTVAGRLIMKGVLAKEETQGCPIFRPALPEPNFQLLLDLLPLLGGDFRLAHFVCLPCEKPGATLSKIEGAVLASFEATESIIRMDGVTDRGRLAKKCKGRERSLSATGNMWLRLGLLKLCWRWLHRNGVPHPHMGYANVRVSVSVGTAGSFEVASWLFDSLRAKIDEVIATVRHHDIEVPLSPWEARHSAHPEDVCMEIQRDLLTAFSHQLTWTPVLEEGDARVMDVVTGQELESIQEDASEAIQAAPGVYGDGARWGVYTRTEILDDGTTSLCDWNAIHPNVVEQWERDHCNGLSIREALRN